MAIISESKNKRYRKYGSTQFRYAVVYVLITFVVLLFLNIYCSNTSQALFYKSKETALVEKCLIAASDISELDVLNNTTIANAVADMDLTVSRMVVTNQSAIVIYDSMRTDTVGCYALFPEILQALNMSDVFSWNYHDGAMQSRAAAPILTYGTLSGCIYIMEYDTEQGALIQSLQRNLLSITLLLEAAVIVFSVFSSVTFSNRLKKILSSMRIIRSGDYTHKVKMGGRDELTLLGDEFNNLTERLQTSESKRRQFVSDASHELKTPLASIKLLSDSILQNDMDMATIREFVGDIGNEAERLNKMSAKLLSLSKVESQEDSDCEIVTISPTVERVTRMLSGIADAAGVTIVHNFRDDCPVLIMEDDLYQITFNLVENGIKYNTPGGTLTISIFRDEDNAILEVKDTGVGVPEEAIGHLFERFYRVDKARSRKTGGSGLGLSIVRSLVERNGGSISVQSTLNEGTVFTVVFPIFDIEEESE